MFRRKRNRKIRLDDLVIDRNGLTQPEGEGDYAANYREKVGAEYWIWQTSPHINQDKNNIPITN
jgi:hypothetical protein